MNIVSIDPSLRHTAIYFNIDGFEQFIEYEYKNDIRRLDVLPDILDRFSRQIQPYKLDLAIIEGYSFGSIGRAITVQAEIGGVFRAIIKQKKIL